MSFLSYNARATRATQQGKNSPYIINDSKELDPNYQGKQRVQAAFPNAIVTKEIDTSSNADPWYDITLKYHLGEENLYEANKTTLKYHLGEENLYEADKTTLIAHVNVPDELRDYKMRMGGRKSRRGSRKSRRRSRRSRK